MEKIRLKVIITLVLCAFSCAFVFAEEGNEEGKNTPPQTQTGSGDVKTGQQEQAPQPVKHTVTFFTDDGNKDPFDEREVESGKTVKLPDPPPSVEEGRQFKGWFTEKDGDTEFADDTPVEGDITVYAKWDTMEPVPDSSPTENLSESSGKKSDDKNIEKPAPASLLLLVIEGTLVLFMAVLVVLNIILLLMIKKKIRRIDEKINAVEEKYDNVEQKFAGYDSILEKQSHQFSSIERSSFGSSQENVSGLKKEIAGIQNRMWEIEKKVHILNEQKIITQGIASGNLDVKDAFNHWAKNPSLPLPPEAFYYVEGDMKILTKREIKESARETMWITNRKGDKKYLFPNPNLFDQMTSIFDLYKMDPTRLKGRGQNKIKIITPCEMAKNGFVEFPGELELL
jgi:uncharacterized repeat protein (TIGR02543 family)